jgi:integrase
MRSRTVAMAIRVYQELERLWSESGKDKDGLVFGVRSTIKKAWQHACRDAKITGCRFHDCRATAISRMVQAGLPIAEVMRISGHATLRAFYIYVRTDADALFRAASALDAYLAQSAETQATSTELVN